MSAQSPVDHRLLFRLSWPILVTMFSYTTLAVVNSIYVGWLGTADLAAIGIAMSVVYLVQAFGLGLLGGVRILVANRTGADRPSDVRAASWTGLGVALILGLAVASLAPIGPQVFRWLGASDEVVPLASGYYAWRTVAAPISFLFVSLVGAFQGRGDTRTPMVAHLVANGVNLAADPVLIFGWGPVPAFGIDGAGMGCALGLLCGLVFIAVRARSWIGRPTRPDPEQLRALWRVGAPSGMQSQLDVASFVVLAGLLAHAGDAHLAAHVIVVRIVMLSFLPCHALAEATGVLVGQSLGASNPERARQAMWVGVVQAVGVMVAFGVVFLAIPDRLVAVFGAAPEVVAIATPIIGLYALLQVVDGIGVVVFGALTGAGDTRFTMSAALTAAWLVKLPIAAVAVLGLGLGAYGAWLGIAGDILFSVALVVWRIRGSEWLQGHSLLPEAGVVPA